MTRKNYAIRGEIDPEITRFIEAERETVGTMWDLPAEERRQVDAMFEHIERLGRRCRDKREFDEMFYGRTVSQEYYSLLAGLAVYVRMPEAKGGTPDEPEADAAVERPAEQPATTPEKTPAAASVAPVAPAAEPARDIPGDHPFYYMFDHDPLGAGMPGYMPVPWPKRAGKDGEDKARGGKPAADAIPEKKRTRIKVRLRKLFGKFWLTIMAY